MSSISETMVDEKIKTYRGDRSKSLNWSEYGMSYEYWGRLRRKNKNIQVLHVAEVLAKG